MRWLTFGLLVILAVSFQTTVAPRIAWQGLSPDWVLVLVVFYCLHARLDHALLAGWVAGAAADLMTVERFGLISLSYGLVALLVCWVRDLLFTRHPLTHFTVTLCAALFVQVLWTVYRVMVGLPVGSPLHLAGSSLYTALWAPPLHALLLKAPRLLGLRPPRYSGARLSETRRSGV
ncbi:MAG: rod shape-determining protein MreD [Planctomycetota bacterium]|jgi:rod shape-determining protein MreD